MDDPELSDTPRDWETDQRDAFYETLASAAKERFLAALEAAAARGASEDEAWEQAVVAAETTYAPPETSREL